MVKVGLKTNSKKLESMLSNKKSGNNKGLGFSIFDAPKQTKTVFLKAAPQNSSFNSASSSKSKTFTDRTPQPPKKAKNVQTGK